MFATQKQDPRKLVGSELAGRYRIDEVVEEGGFGVIYKGVHTSLLKSVAVKVLKTPTEYSASMLSTFVQNFTLEAQTIAKMTHPHIVQVLDFGVSEMPDGEKSPWMVMEWLDGKPLSRVLRSREGQTYGPKEMLELIQPVFEALAYAHDMRVAHRDLKPANIMMLETRRGLFAKLLDFGIAKVMDEGEQVGSGHTHTRSAAMVFSPRYAAPEQLSQARTGPWTDVHAMALIVTEMLIGRPAIDSPGKDTTALYSQILRPDRPTPKSKGYDVGPWEPVIAKAMALSPQDRYQHAGEFLAALQANVPATVTNVFFLGAPGSIDGGALSQSGPQPSVTGPQSNAGLNTLSGSSLTGVPAAAPRRSAGLILAVAVLLAGGAAAGGYFAMRGKPSVASQPLAQAAQPAGPPAKPAPPVIPPGPGGRGVLPVAVQPKPPVVAAQPKPPVVAVQPGTPTVTAQGGSGVPATPATVENPATATNTTATAQNAQATNTQTTEGTNHPATSGARTGITGRRNPRHTNPQTGLGFDVE